MRSLLGTETATKKMESRLRMPFLKFKKLSRNEAKFDISLWIKTRYPVAWECQIDGNGYGRHTGWPI